MTADTPRTDAALEDWGSVDGSECPEKSHFVHADFARELERENAKLRAVLESIRDTAIAMDDAVRMYPRSLTIMGVEGPARIKSKANEALK